MDKLLCPDCGHEVGLHGFDTISLIHYCGENNSMVRCKCHTTEINAYRKAQRAAAIAHLRKLAKIYVATKKSVALAIENEPHDVQDYEIYKMEKAYSSMCSAANAYRAVGILKERKP